MRKKYTYAELDTAVGFIQSQISATGLPLQSNIGVFTFDDLATYASLIAIMFSGHAFVPLNPYHPADRNQSIIEQARISHICSSKSLTGVLDGLAKDKKIISTIQSNTSGYSTVINSSNPDNNAYVLFTSGSTGVPKGVPITIGNLNAFLDAFFALGYQIGPNDRFLQMFDLTFDLSIMSYLAPLCIGASVYSVPFDSIKYMHVYKLLEDHQLTFALMVPSILTHLRQYFDEIQLPDLKYSLFCGEALFEDITLEWAKCAPNAQIENVYGPTEATIFCTTYLVNRNGGNKTLNGIVNIGKAMNNMETIIVNDQLLPVKENEKGELCLSGSQVTPGYWMNEEKNREAFFNLDGKRYYRTGDLCFKDAEGDIFYSGRVDFQVKIQGFRVELGEIEHHARLFLKNINAVCVARQNESTAWQLYLFVENQNFDSHGLMDYLKIHLPSYMVPVKIFGVDEFPLNANGKTDRKKLISTIENKNPA